MEPIPRLTLANHFASLDDSRVERHPEPSMSPSDTTRDENGVVPAGRVPVVLRARPRV